MSGGRRRSCAGREPVVAASRQIRQDLHVDPILDDLNPEQRAAVLHGTGPLMVVAGAGSGKTRVITRRIARLLRDAVPPQAVLALTFTNKAAGEMARRVQELGGARVRVATFHSACARFLRQDGGLLGFPRDFSIYDTYDRDSCLKMLMAELDLDKLGVKPSEVGRAISRRKNLGEEPGAAITGFSAVDQIVEKIFGPYQELMLRLGALDFDDLLGKFVELLRCHPEARESYQQRYPWLLIDEFQDTNRVQYDLVQKLASGDNNICVVGDPDQSIYKFRGADVRNILDFECDFGGTTIIRLETNYRSTKTILRAAEGVIENNQRRLEKRLRTDNDEGVPITLHRCAGPAQEAREIARRVDGLFGESTSPEQIAVFYRSHFLSRSIEEAFREFAVPYRVIGGVSFFERREIKDLLAFLKVVVNPLDDVSMERIVNVPPRGIGKKTLGRLRAMGANTMMSLFEVVMEPSCRAQLSARAKNNLDELAATFDELKRLADQGAHAVLRHLVERIAYLDFVGDLGDPEDSARVDNVAELHSDAAFFDEEIGGGLSSYLQHVSLMTSEDRNGDDREERVSLMTVHAAKGLEFDHVFVSGLEEGLFPNQRALDDEGGVEEERRLMYVALTRARRALWLGVCGERRIAGRMERQIPSSFLNEIPADCLTTVGAASGFDTDWGDSFETYEPEPSYEQDDSMELDYSQEPVALDQGVRVIHAVYGPGTVVTMSGRGLQAKAKVDFDRSGERILILEYANLQVLPGELPF